MCILRALFSISQRAISHSFLLCPPPPIAGHCIALGVTFDVFFLLSVCCFY